MQHFPYGSSTGKATDGLNNNSLGTETAISSWQLSFKSGCISVLAKTITSSCNRVDSNSFY